MREAIGTGDTVEEAREAACGQLGVETYDAEFEILQMPTKKTFGLFGGSPAKVRVFIQDSPASVAAEYLTEVLGGMGLTGIRIEIKEEEDGALLSLTGDDIGFVIGHRGETLDALQYLAGLVANHVGNSYYRIALDIGNYREKRRETLQSLGRKIAEKAVKTGRNVALEPMNPYERRIIHMAVQSFEGAKSWSEGEDLGRHVVIGPVNGERPISRRGGGYAKGGRRPYRKPPAEQRPGSRQSERTPVQAGPPVEEKKVPLYGRIKTDK